jgi:DNA-binding CsgD family transcriptional regulator
VAAQPERSLCGAKLQLSEMEREILKLHRQGLRPVDLATLSALDDATVSAFIFGE